MAHVNIGSGGSAYNFSFNLHSGATLEDVLKGMQVFVEQLVAHMANNASELRASLLQNLQLFLQTQHAAQLPNHLRMQAQDLANTPIHDTRMLQSNMQCLNSLLSDNSTQQMDLEIKNELRTQHFPSIDFVKNKIISDLRSIYLECNHIRRLFKNEPIPISVCYINLTPIMGFFMRNWRAI